MEFLLRNFLIRWDKQKIRVKKLKSSCFYHWKLHFMMLMEQCNYVGQWDRTILISWTISSFDINTHNVTCHQVRGRLYTSQNRFSFFCCVSNSRISRPVSLSVCLSHFPFPQLWCHVWGSDYIIMTSCQPSLDASVYLNVLNG